MVHADTPGELAEFLATRTRLATTDPSIAGAIAVRLYDNGWRRPDPAAGEDERFARLRAAAYLQNEGWQACA